MSKNRVIIYSKDATLMATLQKFCLQRGYFDFTYLFCADVLDVDFDEECQKTVVVCPNRKIDAFVQKICNSQDKISLVFEQAVLVVREENEILFVPDELDPIKFLQEFLPQKDCFSFCCFNISALELQTKLSFLGDISYQIITNSSLMQTLLCNKDVMALDQTLKAVRGQNLKEEINKILSEKQLSLALADGDGKIFDGLNFDKALVLKTPKDFAQLIGAQAEICSDTAYNVAKTMLKDADVEACVFETENNAFVCVGNKDKVHVHSLNIEKEFKSGISDYAQIKLYNFLKEI